MEDVYGEGFASFTHFSLPHFIFIGFFLLAAIAVPLIYKKQDKKTRRKMLIGLTWLILADEALKQAVSISTGQFTPNYLPFHLCSVNIFVSAFHTYHPTKLTENFLYYLSIPGGLLAILMPTWTPLPFLNIFSIHSCTVHILLVLYPLLLLVDGARPDMKNMPRVLLLLLLLCIPGVISNAIFDTNFMFLNGSENNPILKLFEGWLGDFYFILLVPLLFIVWGIMYLPWHFVKIKNKKAIEKSV